MGSLQVLQHLVDLLHCWASTTTAAWHATTWHTARHATIWCTACCLVHLHHDWVHDTLKLFLPRLEFVFLSQLVLVQPIKSLLNRCLDLLFVAALKLVLQLVIRERVPHGETIILQTIFGLDLLLVHIILGLVLFCLLHHAVNLRLRQPPLLVRDCDLVRLAACLVLRRNIEDAIRIDIECYLNLWDAAWRWGNAIKMEFAKQVVILRHRTLAFEDLDKHTWLVVRICGESLALLRRNRGVALDELCHHTTRSFETH